MSGTSADGIDMGIVAIDQGGHIHHFGPHGFAPYDTPTRQQIKSYFGKSDLDPITSPAAAFITDLHARAARDFLARHADMHITAVGFHGQTIYHNPSQGISRQLGDGAALARALGKKVIWDFRSKDMAAGGQGAPLMPVVHEAVAAFLQLPPPLVFVNIGGVANITYIDNGQLAAGDVGPGNALMDDYCQQYLGISHDEGGQLAMGGRANRSFVASWCEQDFADFFHRPLPKSLDRDHFKKRIAETLSSSMALPAAPLSPANLHQHHANNLATLAFFTAHAIAYAVIALTDHAPTGPRQLIVAGGGARNRAVMDNIKILLQPHNITVTSLGDITGDPAIADNMEAFGFGLLAMRLLTGMPTTFPSTTGVARPTSGGRISTP